MSLLSLLEISKQYGDNLLLNNLSLTINEKERIALIGKNGSGKSTLLGIIDSSIQQDSGQRIVRNNIKITTLPQHISFDSSHTVQQSIESSLSHIREAHDRWIQISNTQDFLHDCALKQEYNMLYSYISQHDGWDLESKVKYIMQSFDIMQYKDRLSISLSGGEQKRVILACILLSDCDIVILDEPTNHLDVEMVEFLEKTLCNMSKSIIFVSHDRYFIDKVATRVIELENGKLNNFIQNNSTQGAYLSYLQAKQQMLHNLQKEQEVLKKILKNEEQWLQRGVKARLKRNEGRKERLFALREKVKSMPTSLRSISQTLEKTFDNIIQEKFKNAKKILFELHDFSIKIGNITFLDNLNLIISQGEKLGIVGKNGSGKSTFLRALLGKLQDSHIKTSGLISRSNISIGYFDQHKSMLQDSKTLIETFCPNGGDTIDIDGKNIHVYGYLKGFLFPKSELQKKVGLLSGGEKSRVALALLLTKQYDCLILDEPTNDLDIATMNIVESYLQSYKGAIIFVSHDRYFTDKIAQRLLVIQPKDSLFDKAAHFISHSSYSEIIERHNEIKELSYQIQHEVNQSPKFNNVNPTNIKPQKKLSYKEQLEYDTLELEIQELENIAKQLESYLANPDEYMRYGVEKLSQDLLTTKENLEFKWERFIELSNKCS